MLKQSNRKEKAYSKIHSCSHWLYRECEILGFEILVSLTKANQFFEVHLFKSDVL